VLAVMRVLACLIVAPLAACDASTPRTLLDGPRVLAIVAEPPVIALDTTTRLAAITALDGLPAVPDRIEWRACAPWAVVVDPVRDCAGEAALALATDADGGAVLDPEEIAAGFSITLPTIPPAACAAPTPALTVVAELELAGVRLIAKKQVPIAATADRANPVFVQVRIGGEPIAPTTAVPAGATVLLSADIAVDTLDLACRPDGASTLEEVRVVTYPGGGAIASDDAFTIADRDGTLTAGSVELTLPDEPATVPLWLVAVDETGGAAATFSPLVTRAP
jgi:hypothetical protein